MRKLIYTLSLVGGLLSASTLHAQGIFSTAELSRSSRSISMGGITSVSGPNAFSVYENASAVAFSDKKLEAGAMYKPWAKQSTRDMSRDNLLIDAAAYYSLDEENKLLLGAGYFAPGGNDLFQMDPSGNFIGDRVKPKYLSVQAGYARRLSSAWGVSAVLDYAYWNPGITGTAHAIGIDLGVTYRLFWKPENGYLDIALKAAGWGVAIADEGDYKLPGLLAVGALWHKPFGENHRLNLEAEAGYRCMDESALRAAVGCEYSYRDFLFVRCGYSYTDLYSSLNSYGTVGAGVRVLSRVQLDFSYLLAKGESPFKDTYAIGFCVLF